MTVIANDFVSVIPYETKGMLNTLELKQCTIANYI